MKIKPFGNQILIAPVKDTIALITPDAVLLNYGKVLDVGKDVKEIKIGDKICFTIWGLNHVEIGEEKHYLVPEDPQFILGTLYEE